MLGPSKLKMYSWREMDCAVLGDRSRAFITHIPGYLAASSFLVAQEVCCRRIYKGLNYV